LSADPGRSILCAPGAWVAGAWPLLPVSVSHNPGLCVSAVSCAPGVTHNRDGYVAGTTPCERLHCVSRQARTRHPQRPVVSDTNGCIRGTRMRLSDEWPPPRHPPGVGCGVRDHARTIDPMTHLPTRPLAELRRVAGVEALRGT
jgi:hypothetical protein